MRAVVVIRGPDVPVPVGLHIEEAAVVCLDALIVRAEVGTDLRLFLDEDSLARRGHDRQTVRIENPHGRSDLLLLVVVDVSVVRDG